MIEIPLKDEDNKDIVYKFREKVTSIDYMVATAMIPPEYQLTKKEIENIKNNKATDKPSTHSIQYQFALQIGLICAIADLSNPLEFDDLNDDPALLGILMIELSGLLTKFTEAFSLHAAVEIPSAASTEIPMESSLEEETLPPSN